ncbi:cytochrome P450 [Ammoniphilus sp. YIM 78166]|uniref:cytochrome P450 n=1 Tax=Ammoniphilus sp. YIM 78166 TaxID=1644106 RepID=UPI00106F6B48|nr:cytochrome P450 [Ammoniphilus sp. YIM 78166]
MTSVLHLGDIVSVRSSKKTPSYILNHPEAIREVLVSKEQSFRKGRSSRILRETVGQGILTTEGEKHGRQRQSMLPAFHKQRIQEYAPIVIEQATRTFDKWQDGEERWIHRDFMTLTLTVILETLFGSKKMEDPEKIARAVEETIQYTAKRMYSPIPLPKFIPTRGNLRHTQSMRVLQETAKSFVQQQEKRDSPSLLRHLLEEEGVEEQELIDQIITMLIAGHETTANALSWTWYLLSQHPEVEAKWREELHRVLGDRPLTYEDLTNLAYTQQIWQESLRLYPPAWMILREANEDVDILGEHFSRHSIFMICPYSLHRNPQYFYQQEKFMPERFADQAAKSIPRYAYLPFGAGSRSCIGNQFASMEAMLIMVLLAQRYRLVLAPSQAPIQAEPSVSLRIKGGLKMVVKK